MLPALIAAGVGGYLLYRKHKKTGFGNLPPFDVPLEAGYSYYGDERFPSGHSWSYMRLSPEFQWHEKPIPPHNAYTDMAPGNIAGSIQSDPYYRIDYDYNTGVDYYRHKMDYQQVGALDNTFGGKFAAPATDAFSTMINSAADKISDFIRG